MREYPIGVPPTRLWIGLRIQELKAAIQRYRDAGLEVDPQWIKEYHELIRKFNDEIGGGI